MKITLLASAPTKDAIAECIARFYCGETKILVETHPNKRGTKEWRVVSQNGKDVSGARVVKKRNRFRFEMIG